MSDYIGVVTNAGQAKIAAAIGGTALNPTTIRVGDGNGAPIVPNPAMTDLVRRVGAGYPIVSSGRDPVHANHWRVTALIPVADGPFDIREIGVWDAAGDMIAVARHVLVEKRTPAQGAAVELLTDIVFPVSETAQVTVQVTPSAQISIFQMLRAGFMVVESATLAAPPVTPALGRTHVVPAGATGAWAGLAGMLVQWNGIVWVAVDAPIGFHVVDQSMPVHSGNRWLERVVSGWDYGLSRLIQKQPGNSATASGTENELSITLSPPPANLAALTGVPLYVTITTTNTGPATLTVNGLTAPIANANKGALIAGDLPASVITPLMFDGASFCLTGFARGRLINVRVFQGGGVYPYTPTPGTDYVEVEVMAAGGGGAGVPATAVGETAAGGPGGSGGWAYKLIRSGFAGVPVTVGVGGIGGDGAVGFNAGGNGGASSFGAHVSANGGGGGISAGQTGTFDGYYALGGVAATLGPSGDIRAPGLDGAATLVINKSGVPVGRTPSRYAGGQGSGGSGQTSSQSTAAKTGNLGADGMVIVREYA